MNRRKDLLMNGVPRLVLRSPLHPLMSSRYCLLEFTGRTSGAAYVVPVAYRETADGIVVSTESRWWRNLTGDRTFRIRLRGRSRPAQASVLRGTAAESALADLLTIGGYAKAAGVMRENGVVTPAELRRACAERTLLAIRCEPVGVAA